MPDYNFGEHEAVFVSGSGSSKQGKRLIGGLLLDEITNEHI